MRSRCVSMSGLVVLCAACLSLTAVVPEAGAQIINGVGQTTVTVNPTSGNCGPVAVSIDLNAGSGFISFTHAGAVATTQSVTSSVTVNPDDDGESNPVTYNEEEGGVGPTGSEQASGSSIAIKTAMKAAGPPKGATATASVTYTFMVDDCEYSVTVTVTKDAHGNVTHNIS